MESMDSLIEIDYDKNFSEVLIDYRHNLDLFSQAVENTIQIFLSKKTISRLIEMPSIHPLKFFDSYKDNRFYKPLCKQRAIDLMPEYHLFTSILLRERIVGKRYFDFLELIRENGYDDPEMEKHNQNSHLTIQQQFFQNDVDSIIHQSADFIRSYLDSKLSIMLENIKSLSLEGITHNTLLLSGKEDKISRYIVDMVLSQGGFFRDFRFPKSYSEYQFQQLITNSIADPACDVPRISFLKMILPDVSDAILIHHRAIFNRVFMLKLRFTKDQQGEDIKGLELHWIIEQNHLPAMRFNKRFNIHADHLNLLYQLCIARPKVSKLKATYDSVISGFNTAMFNQFMIETFIQIRKKRPQINPEYAPLIQRESIYTPRHGLRSAKRK